MEMDLYGQVISKFVERIRKLNIDAVAGVESRGFWFGPAIAQQLNVPFAPIRKHVSFHERPIPILMIWNTVQQRLKFKKILYL